MVWQCKKLSFKTAFVIDEANKKSIFAITQNIELVNESRKKKGGGGVVLPKECQGFLVVIFSGYIS